MTIHLIDRDDYAGAYKISNKQAKLGLLFNPDWKFLANALRT